MIKLNIAGDKIEVSRETAHKLWEDLNTIFLGKSSEYIILNDRKILNSAWQKSPVRPDQIVCGLNNHNVLLEEHLIELY